MPIYEYHCKDCGKEFEVLQKISALPLTECKYCSGNVEKMVSNSSFKFKGGGWYITDYKNKSKKNSSSSKTVKKTDNEIQKKNKNAPETKKEIKPVNNQRKVS